MKKLYLPVLAGVPLIMVLGNSMLIPVLPAMKKALGISSFQAGLIITLFSVPAGLAIPCTGFFADRFGRRAVLLPALALYALGGLAAGCSAIIAGKEAFLFILLSRALQGIGAAGTAPVAMTLAGDLFGGAARSRALGFLEAANGVGKIMSPILGAAIGLFGWFYPFFVFPILVLPVLLAILFLIPEPPTRRQVPGLKQYWLTLGAVLRQKGRSLGGIFFAGATALLVLFGLLFFLSEYLETAFRAGGTHKGLLLAVPVFFMCVAAYLTGWAIKRRLNLMPFVVVTGLLLITGALLSLIFCCGTVPFFTAVSVAGVGTGLTLPCLNTLVTSSVGPNARGIVTALYGGVRFWGVAVGPPLFGFLLSYSRGAAFAVAGTLTGLAALATLLFVRGSVIANPLRAP
ncbi:ACDE family multidrug resistance protein [Thermodesulfitimonas autotrophica]|uniref:ACDE family multidrug resistance protein n=1 Tax=Thermodesulfitimonas autotrophica TaxID=1894989 RepID=A0A3N5AN10_9THEO|nr:MFS transporter [Thermodesulfitimonas autotrophica]RPF46576.1 ACDE family multidrug resistance protein [Thermodesulfitimonas autotrophica]